MSDLRELYQEVILDHSKAPRNFRAMEGAPNRSMLKASTRCAAITSPC